VNDAFSGGLMFLTTIDVNSGADGLLDALDRLGTESA
jgi:hypothetical protein